MHSYSYIITLIFCVTFKTLTMLLLILHEMCVRRPFGKINYKAISWTLFIYLLIWNELQTI